MKHVDGTLYLITFNDGECDQVASEFLAETVQGCIDAVYDKCYEDDCLTNGGLRERRNIRSYYGCKIRAIHDADGVVRDVTEDIARVMMDDLFDGYVDIYDWPIWAELMGLKMADFGFEVEPDYDPHEYF